MSKRKQYLAAITAHVIKGLPAPISVDLEYGGDPEYLGIKLDTIAEALEWLALEPGAWTYDHRYEPNDNHPHGYRILGGTITMLGVRMHITAVDDLPGPVGTEDAEAVLAFVATVTTVPAEAAPEGGHRYACCGKVGRISRHESWCPTNKPDVAAPAPGEAVAGVAASATAPERAVEQDPAALDGLGVAVTGAEDVAYVPPDERGADRVHCTCVNKHAPHGWTMVGEPRHWCSGAALVEAKPDADGDLIAPYTAEELS